MRVDRHTRFNDGTMNHWEGEVYKWQYSERGSYFDMQLVILYSKADNSNRKRIAQGFPELANAFNDWQHAVGVFTDEHNAPRVNDEVLKILKEEKAK